MTLFAPATIAVEGITLQGFHGVYPAERENGNTFIIDVYVKTDITAAATSDQLADTLDYSQLYNIVVESMAQPANLLEHLAHRIGSRILARYSQVESVKVKIAKHKPMLMQQCAQTSIEALFVK